ncbi:MAG: hypothetical protein AB9873_04940 [Syntrophobacteraceae bacterium]
MTTCRPARAPLACILLLASMSCAAPIQSTGSLETGWHAMQPIRARVLLLVPDELDQFVYLHSGKRGAVQIPLGRTAVDQIDTLLGSAFTSSSVMLVASEAEARDKISREDPELRAYDFVALPKFLSLTSSDSGFEEAFEVDVLLELSSFDTGRVEKIRGHGEARIPVQAGSSPEGSARTALSYAVDALKDGLEARRAALSR